MCRRLFLYFISSLLLVACVSNIGKNLDDRDMDLYDRVGYRPGSAPSDIQRKNEAARISGDGDVRVVPDYYYHTPDRRDPRNAPPKRAARPPVQSLRYEPSSRYYNNPYSFKPPLNFPYFDSDQYYVPPTGNGMGHDYHNDNSSVGNDQINSGNSNKNVLY